MVRRLAFPAEASGIGSHQAGVIWANGSCRSLAWSVVLLLLMTVSVGSTAWGWGGPTHSKLAQFLLDDPVISPFVTEFGIDRSSVISWTGEPPDAWHHPGWEMIRDRGYLGVYSGVDWTSLSETTRLKYLIHIATDCGVPLGHSPAREVYINTVAEAALEAQVSTWSSYPSVVGTSYYQHSRTGYAAQFTGSYSDITNTFYYACLNNASWFKSTPTPWYLFGAHEPESNKAAGWNGTTLGQMLGRAMLADYFLAKRDTVAAINGSYAVNPGGNVTFSAAGSYDPDSISWATNGTYYNNGGGLTAFDWDLTNNGVWDVSASSFNLNYDQLYSLVGPTEGRTIQLRVIDNEGKAAYASTTLAVYTQPTAAGQAQYGWLGKPGDVPSLWDWDNLIDNGSYDLDGGSVTTWAWDLNNDGDYEKAGGSSTRVYYSDFEAAGVAPNENHTVTLQVTDNEGATSTISGIAMPVLVNPVVDSIGGPYVFAPGAAQFAGAGHDPDGGSITAYGWDVLADGSVDYSGSTVNLTYRNLVDLGLAPGTYQLQFAVTDNDADITGWWAGQASVLTSLTLLDPIDGDANCDGLVDVLDLGVLATSYGNASGTTWHTQWLVGDFSGDGLVDVVDLGILASNYGYGMTGGTGEVAAPEPGSLLLLVLAIPAVCRGRHRQIL